MKKRQQKKQRAAPSQDDPTYQVQNEQLAQGQIIGGKGHKIRQYFFNEGKAISPPDPTPPEWVCNIPYPPNPYFTGREELLSRLDATLRTGQPAALSQPQAISGLGGIGKTQIALAYAYQHKQDYQAILWSRADTTEALISGFAMFAELLQLPQKDEKDQLVAVEVAKNWLKTHNQWLLILDNADDLEVVRDFLPSVGLIITHKFLEPPVERVAKAEIIRFLFNTTWLVTIARKSVPKDMGNDKLHLPGGHF